MLTRNRFTLEHRKKYVTKLGTFQKNQRLYVFLKLSKTKTQDTIIVDATYINVECICA